MLFLLSLSTFPEKKNYSCHKDGFHGLLLDMDEAAFGLNEILM
jgi:hypothetical protein